METVLVKIFATALALSQVATTPDAVRTRHDRVRDQGQVAELLHAGCTHMRKAFDIEDINLECMSSEHFGQLAWQFKRVSGSSGLKVQAAIAC